MIFQRTQLSPQDELDINSGLLTLSFSERVDGTTVDPEQITLYAHNLTVTDPLGMHIITGGEAVSANNEVLVICLS